MIEFGCDPGFIPTKNTTAVCASDGRWIPDPATLVCTCKSTHSHLQYKKLWVGGVVSRLYNVCTEYIMSKQKPNNVSVVFRAFGNNYN